jgi:hypothetical protein
MLRLTPNLPETTPEPVANPVTVASDTLIKTVVVAEGRLTTNSSQRSVSIPLA